MLVWQPPTSQPKNQILHMCLSKKLKKPESTFVRTRLIFLIINSYQLKNWPIKTESNYRFYHQRTADENTSHCSGKHRADMMAQQHLNNQQAFLHQPSACPSRFSPKQFWFHHEHINSREASAVDPYTAAANACTAVY